ncbi:MAG: methylated-DNA--[protein]-cysteine S-methyltransferase [Chloroflexota bacterium]|nr:methylated-DNA--[protein]-cysteine S-methyltransferase [Chloroflexota bacterium]MDE2894759.1 methylated-DNA--[protein]-cysteine S-methyltransferase [Chloroflexota bacterium]
MPETTRHTEPLSSDRERLWAAVQTRDAHFDGHLIYAVRSTGIYCRPSCPSRRPRRAQVAFFATPDEARLAGYRACRRCRPDEAGEDARLIPRACEYIDTRIDADDALPSLTELTNELSVAPARLRRVFKQHTGLTPIQYARGRRLARFKSRLRDQASVADAMYDAGYGSTSRVYETANAQLGMTPASYRKGGAGAVIRFVVSQSTFGGLLVAGTATGICAVKLGDDPDALIDELHDEFPAAAIERLESSQHDRQSSGLHGWLDAILSYLDGHREDIDLPLDVHATVFQWRVWRKLQSIPPGQTRTYGELARELDQPGASRAVGQACASNPVAPIVPCHRAIRADGSLGGYRWGIQRKVRLLELERR